MQAHVVSAAGQMTSQQTQSAAAQAGVPHPPASGHQTPTPSQLQQYTIQQVGVLPPAASGTPQPGPPHAAAYHPLAAQHQHQMVVQQQNVGGQSGPAPQSPQVAYTSGPMPLHYAQHQGGIVAYVPAVSQLQQQQQSHSVNAASLSQQSSASSGSSNVQVNQVQHPPPPAHLMMAQQPQPQPGSASHNTMHPQGMPPMPAGPAVATPVMMPAQPPQPGGPNVVGAGPPGAHQYVQAHAIPGTKPSIFINVL